MRNVLMLLGCLVLAACMTVPHHAYNKSANVHVKKIALVSVANPAEYSVNLVNHPGMSFGLVGGLVAAADVSSKSKTFTQQQVEKYLALGPELTAALRDALRAGGFEVVDVAVDPAARVEFLKEYPPAECDAFLDTTVRGAGYWAQFASTPYLPTMFVPVRLVDSRTQRVLYTTEVFNTDGMVPKGGTQVQPDTAYAFADFAALKADPAKAADGLKKAARNVAGQIVSDLK
jgi:hypothetical protein